ncbi:MFS multidrug transporter [Coccidioides posadasii str. Silveira]|uniref:MFS multidrug transporter n=1 Tax=Coccidioides posadasii (strain RMSCC 757 / Silveira) TaxID=443226 RepID=E9CXV9_COCPS|nr:MFS multidrug transporter [Coccidioides posadasii str. Silveira]
MPRPLPFKHQGRQHGKSTFPSQQLFILGLCRICEPIAFMSIFPYVYHMVSSFHVTEDHRKIALYAGAVTSAFTFAEFCAGVFWGRMSDTLGRKPVLLMGLVGTAISMLLFGLASSLPVALLARALGGLLNGNIGVLQTTVAELVTEKEHQARAYSIMPFVWCLGSIIGPALGGALAQPCQNYPALFSGNSIFAQYPFLLPNLVCVVILVVGITIGTTHFLLDGSSFGYKGTESRPGTSSSKATKSDNCFGKQNKSILKIFTPRVIYIILGYGILAYHSVSFDQLMPIFLSSPISNATVDLPFKFQGGLGLSTKVIGFMMAVQGVYAMIAQLWFFPFIVRVLGTLKTYRLVMCIWPPLYLLVPYLVLLPSAMQIPAVYMALISKITLHVIAFPSNSMLLADAAASKSVLGSINGVGASVASLSRCLGPTFTGFLHSRGLESGYSILSWWVCGAICLIGAIESFWIEDDEPDQPQLSEKVPIEDYEAGVHVIEPVESQEELLFIPPSSSGPYDFFNESSDTDDILALDPNDQ